MTAEPSASIWEVTRLILDSPDRSPTEIAHEHGYSAAEVAELMPIFLDTARTDWARLAGDADGWTTPASFDGQDAELFLRDLAESGSIEAADVDAPADPFDAEDLDADDATAQDTPTADDDLSPDLGELLDEVDDRDPDGLDGVDGADGSDKSDELPELDDLDGPEPPLLDPSADTPPQPDTALPEPSTPDDGLELGDDDPFDGDPYADLTADRASDLTETDPSDQPADLDADDVGDPFAG